MSILKSLYLFALLSLASPALASEKVGVRLVLALDCSSSVSPERWRAQIKGYERAFKSKELLEALLKVPAQSISVTVVVWSSANEQEQVVPWTHVSDESSALFFAFAVSKIPMLYRGYTNIGSAIDFSRKLFPDKADATKNVIDISGDGQHRESSYPDHPRGVPLEKARAAAIAEGITINGLPIEGEEYEIAEYFRDHVIGGDGAFIEVVKDPDDIDAFARAILRKIIRELVS